jgi:hypothetical protein
VATIAGYCGRSDALDEAIGKFAMSSRLAFAWAGERARFAKGGGPGPHVAHLQRALGRRGIADGDFSERLVLDRRHDDVPRVETFRELEEEKLKGATVDIGKLYEKFVDQTLARDEGKHVIDLREKRLLLGELALHLHVEGLNDISNNDLDQWLMKQIKSNPELDKLHWVATCSEALKQFRLFLQDLRNGSLLVRPGEKDFRFGHTSVREFFLAEAQHRHIREGRLDDLGERRVTDETIDFLIARQRNGASERDARRFREQFSRLLEPGRSNELRWFSANIIWRLWDDLPWPEIADFSDFDLTNCVFASPGLDEGGAREIPPQAIWRGARLHGAKFIGLALHRQDFSGADASSSFWVDCDFSGAVTEGLDLSGAELRRSSAPSPLVHGHTSLEFSGATRNRFSAST